MNTRPDGPKGHWLMGSLNDFLANPLTFLMDAGRQYGDIFSFRMGPATVYVLNHPDLVHQVLVEDASKFQKSALQRKLRGLLGNGLVLSEGDFWKRQRKLAQPAFHAKRIGAYADIMVNYTLEMLDRWQSGVVYDFDCEMSELTMRIIAKTMFDTETSDIGEQVSAAMATLQDKLADKLRSPLQLPDWVPTEKNRSVNRAIDTLDQVVWRFIDERRMTGEDKGDLLSMLLLARDDEGNGMSDTQLRDEVITLFLAGHETTAKTLAWAFYALTQNPDVEAKLREELHTVLNGRVPTLEDLRALPYTDKVIKETLRLYPVAWQVSREPVEDVNLGGYTVKKGSPIFISPFMAQRDPRFFEDPERFDPERFTPEAEKARPAYTYFPFGGGPRVCIGNQFALMEARLILATVMQRFQFKVAPGHQIEGVPLLTYIPKNGMPMVVTKRVLEYADEAY